MSAISNGNTSTSSDLTDQHFFRGDVGGAPPPFTDNSAAGLTAAFLADSHDGIASKNKALQAVLNTAVSGNQAPFMVGMTANASGTTFSGAAGDAAPGLKAGADTVFRIFSMTKAIGSTAAMMLIDRGLLSMDTTVESVLPEFSNVQILEGWDGNTPILRTPRVKATIRHLATHTAGLEYEFWRPEMQDYLKKMEMPSILAATLKSLHAYPMMTEPGTRWGYGISTDWLGRVVEAVSGQRIDVFLKDHLFDPLKMMDTDVEVRPHMQARLASVKARGADGKFVDSPVTPPENPEYYSMGHALYSTPNDYLRFLRMILNKGTLDGARILSEAAVHSMLQNQMGPLTFEKMSTADSSVTADFDPFPQHTKTHGFGFLRVETDVPGRRHAGTVSWAGVLNTHYWVDPSANLAAVLMTQTLPFVEPPYMAAYDAFESAAYA